MRRHDLSYLDGIVGIVAAMILTCFYVTLVHGTLIHWLWAAAGIYIGLRAVAFITR